MTDDTQPDVTLLAPPSTGDGCRDYGADWGPDCETQPMWIPQALLDDLSLDESGD